MPRLIQLWLHSLSLKKQTVTIGAIRAPDVSTTRDFRQISKWIRATCLENADPSTGFMEGAEEGLLIFEEIDREFERLTLHATHHILLALQVIAFDHPDKNISDQAKHFIESAIEAQHLNVETREQYENRYRPRRKEG